jgi:hypothetical protein
MAEGRNRRLWDHTSMIAAAALSSMRERMIDPAKLHPYARSREVGPAGIPITAANIGVLKALLPLRKRSQRRVR